MISIKPEQDVTKRKAWVFKVYHLFQSSVFHIILSVCVCARVGALSMCQCHQFIFVVTHQFIFVVTHQFIFVVKNKVIKT